MKKISIRKGVGLMLAAVMMFSFVRAQDGDKSKRPSPPATAVGKVDNANIAIIYSSPSVKGRQIWGSLVPYDKVWRAGANEATIFTTDQDIKVEGKTLHAGKYSLYAIPGQSEWTIIFNSQTGQWGIQHSGETTEDPSKDVLRVKVKPQKSDSMNEQLTYTIDDRGFALLWENLKIPVSVK
ncbi:MAG: DUF2911 domain-containing protein [Bacteroidetes bacterium]|nr:DUF2911 domain-containing protein [Bacteroidota bacterium]